MSEQDNVKTRNFTNALLLLLAISAVVYFIARNVRTSGSIILSFVGLGAVIFIHELGHFIAGKLSDIDVEAFAIGFGPVVLGVKRIENFLQLRILPTILQKENDPDGLGLLCLRLPMRCKAGETEYQLRIFPIGGFVKLLGQEDVGADKPSDDPRSFVNKPIWKRIMVAAAGVTFNVILAGLFFVIVFTVGINMPPAIIGDCLTGYPADKAGLTMGDEIIQVNGKTNIDFSSMALAAALSGKNKPVNLKVQRTDGTIQDLAIIAEPLPSVGYKGFGILPPISTEIAQVQQPDELYKETGLKPGDVLTAINGDKIEQYWQFNDKMQNIFAPSVSLTFKREGQSQAVVKDFELEFTSALEYQEGGKFSPAHIYGLIPRLEVASIEFPKVKKSLQIGDIIVRAADTANPTYKEIREITTAHADKELQMSVLRNEKIVETAIVPKKTLDNRTIIGIGVGLDVEHSVAAAVADVNIPVLSELPRGSQIVSVAGKEVKNYFDIAGILKENRGKTIRIEYTSVLDNGSIDFVVDTRQESPATRATLLQELPFKPLTRLYRAAGPLDAVAIGSGKTVEFIMQTYMTIKGLIVGSVSPKSLMGPVGMIAASSKIISERDFIQYLHFMGIIGACLAVMNFLPLPILDGGLIVLLIIEKIKGSPVHVKVQEWLTYAGIAVIGMLFVMITYNDIIRVFFTR